MGTCQRGFEALIGSLSQLDLLSEQGEDLRVSTLMACFHLLRAGILLLITIYGHITLDSTP